jgi:hypothetical protein
MTGKPFIRFFVLTLFILIYHTPQAFNSTNTSGSTKTLNNLSEKKWESYVSNLFQSLEGEKKNLKYEVFNKALVGYYNLKNQNKLSDKNLLSVVDFSLPSNIKRLWIINLASGKVLYNSLVSHGKNTGTTMAKEFSNEAETHKSSLGFYVTGNTYYGKHDLSLKLIGMDPTFNCNALNRSIVMHGAKYVSEDWIRKYGMLGRSFGCPAIPVEISKEVINLLQQGTCLFLYYPNDNYEKKSALLNKSTVLAALNGLNDQLVEYRFN